MTQFEMATVVIAIVSGVFGTIGWLLLRLVDHQKQLNLDKEAYRRELTAEKNRTAESKFEQLIQRMDTLVEQIGHLFRDQEMVTESVKVLGVRVGKVEKRIGEHFVRCNEREKLIYDIKDRQANAIKKYDGALLRGTDKCLDRTDRES